MAEAHVGRCAGSRTIRSRQVTARRRVDALSDLVGQALPRVLVVDVQQLEWLPVARLAEGEVQGPDDARPDWRHGAYGDPDGPEGAFLPPIGDAKFLVASQSVDPLVVGPPAFLLGGDGCLAPAPARAAAREVPEERPQSCLVVARDRRNEGLGGAGLADHPARPSLRSPELATLAQDHDGPAPAVRD